MLQKYLWKTPYAIFFCFETNEVTLDANFQTNF